MSYEWYIILKIVPQNTAEYAEMEQSQQPENVISIGYRLCVLASGSLITDIFISFTLIKVSCLHLGQNSGKFSSTVSYLIFNLVLLPQTGQYIHLVFTILHHLISYLSN